MTHDGRPLLWKQRDTKQSHNCVVPVEGGTYRGIAVLNARSNGSIAMGVNETGFCIENSQSGDLAGKGKEGPSNGPFMYLALRTCATVDDFEKLLQTTNETGRRTSGNFGVIDAHGGAVIFEAGQRTYRKFDANDPHTAPNGYIVRANFAASAVGGHRLSDPALLQGVYSAERYCRADALIRSVVGSAEMDHRFLLRNCSRDFADADGTPIGRTINGGDAEIPETIDTTSTICRVSTVSAGVFHGVRPGEDPRLTTLWVILGNPAFSCAVPCWVDATPAKEMNFEKESPLCSLAVTLRDAEYVGTENRKSPLLRTGRLPVVWSTLWSVEDDCFDRVAMTMETWRRERPSSDRMRAEHQQAAQAAYEAMSRMKSVPATPVLEPVSAGGR